MKYEKNKYLVNLTRALNDKIEQELKDNGIEITYTSPLLSNFIIIETDIDFNILKKFYLFSRVNRARIGKLLQTNS